MIEWSRINVSKVYLVEPLKEPDEYDPWEDCIMSVKEWLEDCEEGFFIDYDGWGEMLTIDDDGRYTKHGVIYPSIRHKIPPHITHIEWFNR
jgi:hypothetical protein